MKAARDSNDTSVSPGLCDEAKTRMALEKGDPFLYADWERVVFLHYLIPPEEILSIIPTGLKLETFEGKGCVSVVALTMRSFRPCRFGSPGWLLRPFPHQHFLNLRTYARVGDERGAFFIWGWLSRPFGLPFPSSLFKLTYDFAQMRYAHGYEEGKLCGEVMDSASRRFSYRASLTPHATGQDCPAGSLAEFAMERYSGFFSRGADARVFRIWHPPWLQIPIEVEIQADTLITSKFPAFTRARLAAANFAVGFREVWLGRAHRVKLPKEFGASRHITSSFYEMP